MRGGGILWAGRIKETTMKTISLTKGYVALVDDEDFARLSRRNWGAMIKPNSVYAYSGRTHMHRYIMKPPVGVPVHHRNGNGLDNRRCNLVITTYQENNRQARKYKGTSRHKGVYWKKDVKRWQARISVDGLRFHLGNFIEEASAARAYNAAVLLHLGEGYPLNEVGAS